MRRRLQMKLSFLQEVLLATAAGLALLLIIELWIVFPGPASAAKPVGAGSSRTASLEELPGFALPPRNALRAFVERPLFEKGRRSMEAYAPAEDAVQIADVALVGVIITPDENVAILRAHNSPEPVRARIGDAIGDWQVAQITQNSVLLRNGESVQWISLREGG